MSPLRNPWTNVYGIARSLIALCTLVALLADSADLLFRPLGVEVSETTFHMSLLSFSLFSLLPGPWLPLAKAIAVALLGRGLSAVAWRRCGGQG